MNWIHNLNPNFWDCECEDDYIREKTREPSCPRCGCTHEECPDSRQNEIDEMKKAATMLHAQETNAATER